MELGAKWPDQLLASFKRQDASTILRILDSVFSPQQGPKPSLRLERESDKLAQGFGGLVRCLVEWKVAQGSEDGEFGAFQKFIEAMGTVQSLTGLIRSEEQVWAVEVLGAVLRRAKMLFRRAKGRGANQGKSMDGYMERVFSIIREFSIKFNKVAREGDEVQGQVKRALQPLVHNMAISLYLAVHDYTSCLKKLEEKGKLNPDAFSPHERSLYFYNQGRVKLVGCRPFEAEACLLKVKCLPARHHFVLRYLVPCKLLLGQFADLGALTRYQLVEYIGISEGVRQGNLKLFQQQIRRFQGLWMRRAIYLFMDKVRTICVRNLVRRVHGLLGGPERIELQLLRRALVFSRGGEQMDLEEAGCLIGNLAYLGLMKGYVYHSQTKHLLVLKKDTPFPPVRSALNFNDAIFL